MKGYIISASIPRSNPLVLRRIEIRGDLTAGDLGKVLAVSLGRKAEQIEIRNHVCILPNDTPLDRLTKNDRLQYSLLLNDQPMLPVTMVAGIESETATCGQVPRVLTALGPMFPASAIDISVLNRTLQRDRSAGEAAYALTTGSLAYTPGKVDHTLQRMFDPAHARTMVNQELGAPLNAVYAEQKFVELKDEVKLLDLLYYGQPRKAELVQLLVSHWNPERFSHWIMNEVTYAEYLAFREVVTQDSITPQDVQRLPSFWNVGLLADVKGKLVFGQELLEWYSTIYGTNEDASFHDTMLLCAAFRVCRLLYGVFSFDQFVAIVVNRLGKTINRIAARSFWDDNHQAFDCKPLEPSGATMYDANHLKKPEALALWKKAGKLKHCLPSARQMDELQLHGLSLPFGTAAELEHTLVDSPWRISGSADRLVPWIISWLHIGKTPSEILSDLPYSPFYLRVTKEQKEQALPLLNAARRTIPLVHLAGYSVETYQRAGLGDPSVYLKDLR